MRLILPQNMSFDELTFGAGEVNVSEQIGQRLIEKFGAQNVELLDDAAEGALAQPADELSPTKKERTPAQLANDKKLAEATVTRRAARAAQQNSDTPADKDGE
jgi:hypothetical protein